MSQKQVMPKSEDLSRSLEINAIWTFDTEFPTIFHKSCTYITFKSAVNVVFFYIYFSKEDVRPPSSVQASHRGSICAAASDSVMNDS